MLLPDQPRGPHPTGDRQRLPSNFPPPVPSSPRSPPAPALTTESILQISLGNLGGVIAAFLFVPADAPEYTTGYSVAIGFVVLTIVAATAYMLGIRRENALREMGAAGVDPDDDDADVGDTARTFRYVL